MHISNISCQRQLDRVLRKNSLTTGNSRLPIIFANSQGESATVRSRQTLLLLVPAKYESRCLATTKDIIPSQQCLAYGCHVGRNASETMRKREFNLFELFAIVLCRSHRQSQLEKHKNQHLNTIKSIKQNKHGNIFK